jgi:hypothetical protein
MADIGTKWQYLNCVPTMRAVPDCLPRGQISPKRWPQLAGRNDACAQNEPLTIRFETGKIRGMPIHSSKSSRSAISKTGPIARCAVISYIQINKTAVPCTKTVVTCLAQGIALFPWPLVARRVGQRRAAPEGTRSAGRNVCCDGLAGGSGTGSVVRTVLDSFDPNRSLRNS